MASTPAQIAKDKGNAAFKAGNWADAVGHYSAALVADRTNPTYPLNRAAAYLKLTKYQDAERDCTTVLALDPRNVKAYYRRAQARIGLNRFAEAEKDLRDALHIEPANDTLASELATLQTRIAKQPSKNRVPVDITPPSLPVKPRRRTVRHVPIEIVEVEDGTEAEKPAETRIQPQPPPPDELMTPVHSRRLQPAQTGASTTKSTPRVGGAIFHKDGTQTVFRLPGDSPRTGKETQATTPEPVAAFPPPTLIPPPPETHFQLTRTWSSLPSPSARFSYLKTIPSSSLPALFKSSLDSAFLSSLLTTLSSVLSSSSPDSPPDPAILAYLKAFPSVPRFDTNVLFLSAAEKEAVRRIWERVDSGGEEKIARRRWGV